MPSSDWLHDPKKFKAHFDLSAADFKTLVDILPPHLQERYEETGSANPEAAVLWAIHQGRKLGLVVDGPASSSVIEDADTDDSDGD